MEVIKKYGNPPYSVVLIHGGPGACGEMRPVGQKLSECFGVLEPMNRALTIEGQIKELLVSIKAYADKKPILVGFSWGAWLGIIVAASYPELVSKLILIGCAPLKQHYAKAIYETRISRMNVRLRNEFMKLLTGIEGNTISDRNAAFERLSKILILSDGYDPVPENDSGIELDPDVFTNIWKEATGLRKSGGLLRYINKIRCPVVAIHGDYDPHPVEGVCVPFQDSHNYFQLEMLKNCGHKPWIEKRAVEDFYRILNKHLN